MMARWTAQSTARGPFLYPLRAFALLAIVFGVIFLVLSFVVDRLGPPWQPLVLVAYGLNILVWTGRGRGQ